MGMDAYIVNDTEDANSKSSSYSVLEALKNGENGVDESNMLMEILTRLDIDLAYSSEKLANLDVYMVIVSLGDSRLGELSVDVEIETALIFDLSLGYLESEVTELKRFLNVLRAEIIDGHRKLHSLRQKKETFTAFEGKLHASECSLKHLQKQLSGLERRLPIMRGLPYGRKNTFLYEDVTSEMSGSRLVLRMLDESLSGELDLENQLLGSKEREEDLKSKLLITNVVISDLKSFVEVVLEKLLEAEHCSEVYMGITKEMITRLQVLQFNMHCSVQREGELKSKLQSSLEQVKEKENLEEKVKVLENKLSVLESKLQEVNGSYEASQEEVSLMENTVESLREHVFMAEIRAKSVEDKQSSITEENIELKEELAFLKDGDDNVEKISLLDKQVRDLEVELQIAKTTSEASIEQQNMLYTAIWDMETLIEELRTKVSRGESRADSAEKQCLALAETSIKLNKEISCLKSDREKLEDRFKEANEIREARAKDIYRGANLVTELVVELASERERIQKQLCAMARENRILLEELRKMRKIVVKPNLDNKGSKVKDSGTVVDDPDAGVTIAITTIEEVAETPTSTTASNQVDETADDEAEPSSSSTSYVAAKNVVNDETENKEITRHVSNKYYILAAMIVSVLSIVAMNINWQDAASVTAQQYLGFQ